MMKHLRTPLCRHTWLCSSLHQWESVKIIWIKSRPIGLLTWFTWNTVSKLCQKLSKFDLGLSSVSLKLNFPPKTCIPKSAKITMKRNSSNNSEAIDCMEFSSDATKFDKDRQYLKANIREGAGCRRKWKLSYLVTLKTRSNRTQRNTDIPRGGITFVRVNIISVILPITTKQSKRLNRETK